MCNCNVLIINEVAFCCAGVLFSSSNMTHHKHFLFISICLEKRFLLLSARWQCNLWLLIARTTKVDILDIYETWVWWLAQCYTAAVSLSVENKSLFLSPRQPSQLHSSKITFSTFTSNDERFLLICFFYDYFALHAVKCATQVWTHTNLAHILIARLTMWWWWWESTEMKIM